MTYQQIIYEPGKVARVILNRPHYRNAQSRLLREEMDDAFERAIADEEVKVIVLSGNGEHFSAGHDLGSPDEMADREARGYPTTYPGHYNRIKALNLDNTLRWRNLPKPTIAMVHGFCIFGGWMIATAMDLIFASEDAKFLSSHFQYFSVPWDIGARKAKEILYESRFINAPEALELGLVNRVVPREKLEEETLAYANRVAENDPFLLQLIKFSVNHALDTMGFTTSVQAAYQTYSLRGQQQPGQAPPRIKGKRRLPGVELAFKHLTDESTD